MVDAIDESIAELKAKAVDVHTIRKIAGLRVFKKSWEV